MILKIIIWTIITTVWVAVCGLTGIFYTSSVDKANSESEVIQYLKLGGQAASLLWPQ